MSVYIKSIFIERNKIRFRIYKHLSNTNDIITNVFDTKKNCSFDRNYTNVYSKKGRTFEVKENEIKLIDNLYYIIQSYNVVIHDEIIDNIIIPRNELNNNNNIIPRNELINNNIIGTHLRNELNNNIERNTRNVNNWRNVNNTRNVSNWRNGNNNSQSNNNWRNVNNNSQSNNSLNIQETTVEDILRLQREFEEEDSYESLLKLQEEIIEREDDRINDSILAQYYEEIENEIGNINGNEMFDFIIQQNLIEIGIKDEELESLKPFEGQPKKIFKIGENCSICMDNEVTNVFNNCGHSCTCATCSYSIDKCCICRENINDVLLLSECNQKTIIKT